MSEPRLFRALRHRNFRLFIAGQLVSLVGTWLPWEGRPRTARTGAGC